MKHKKIAIIFLGDYRFDGRCINMINAMISKKYFVDIYHVKSTTNNSGDIASDYLKEVSIIPNQTKIIKYIHWTYLVYNIIKTKNYNNIIASDLYSLFPVCLTKNHQHVIYDSREIYTGLAAHYKSPTKNLIIKCLERFCIQKIYTIITTAITDTNYLKQFYSKYKNIQYYTIYNFPPKININKKSNYLRDKYNIKNHQIILLYQGVLQRGRGIKQMINIVNNTKNYVGVIIGSGELKTHYKQYVYKNKLSNKVYFIDSLPYMQLFNITSSADIGLALIQPTGISNKYALPSKLFEYSMSGISCLSSKLQNMEQYIKKYNLGICVENNLSSQIKAINFLSTSNQKKYYFNNRAIDKLSWQSQEKIFFQLIQ